MHLISKISFIVILTSLYSCSYNHITKIDYNDNEKKDGYHATQANRAIDYNRQNRKKNEKASMEAKNKQTQDLNNLNKPKAKKNITHTGTFKFY